ncbi:MAG: Ribose-5-phosphate isomerase B [candidate division TA06 bacterium ADurb.Bin131]|uniref:Ribose-5-phosphate isomerase B n=1 Tax=candidate division TA06 bacterium ADurb.Bin131 TaxID=1852827 RepID=A0A1V6CA68_UNCT6|nr:MAG: Ribose-5-phosphate isomerase B [candidate division TA06 bacterium ADurb.Bin131]HON05813.1 ribose 5-phosphate isomerase B [bacterium]HRV04574.1 ribose 5-phosphate isomerase B [Candidatus Ratteibacteria bacterium]
MKIGIASDHAGFEMRLYLISYLKKEGYNVVDYGPSVLKKVDYPDYGAKVAFDLSTNKIDRAILICGTGIGMSIVANRFPRVRAALCYNPFLAEIARIHNDANALVLGGRIIANELACEIVRIFLETKFGGGRHLRRIKKIEKINPEKLKND